MFKHFFYSRVKVRFLRYFLVFFSLLVHVVVSAMLGELPQQRAETRGLLMSFLEKL